MLLLYLGPQWLKADCSSLCPPCVWIRISASCSLFPGKLRPLPLPLPSCHTGTRKTTLFEGFPWLILTCRLNSVMGQCLRCTVVQYGCHRNSVWRASPDILGLMQTWKSPFLSSSETFSFYSDGSSYGAIVLEMWRCRPAQRARCNAPWCVMYVWASLGCLGLRFNHLSSSLKHPKLLRSPYLLSVISLAPRPGQIPAARVFIEDLILSEDDFGRDLEIDGLLAAVHLWGGCVKGEADDWVFYWVHRESWVHRNTQWSCDC